MQHHGNADARVARLVARDHGGPAWYEPPGSGRAWERRRQARAARRALRQMVDDDVSTADIERELDDEADREARRAEIRKECDQSILWDDYEWDWDYLYVTLYEERDYDPSDAWKSEDQMWDDYVWDCAWVYAYDRPDYDEEVRAAQEEARERDQCTACYLQGEDPERDDWEVATFREFERRRRARRFHQKYHH